MPKKIFFQKCSLKNIYFLLYIIGGTLETIIKYNYLPQYWKEGTDNKIFNLPYRILSLYISNISDLLCLIPYLIRKKLSNPHKEIEKLEIKNEIIEGKNEQDIELIYNDELASASRCKTIIIYSSIIAVLDFLNYFIMHLYVIIFPDKKPYIYNFDCTVPGNIIFQFISSFLILKMRFHKLHLFTLCLNIFIFIVLLIFDLIIIFNYKLLHGIVYLFYTLTLLCLSIEYSLGKKVILNSFISIYFLLLMRGAFKAILSVLYSLIVYFINKDVLKRIYNCLDNKQKILFSIGNIFIQFFENIFLWIIIDKFSPDYIPLAIIIKQVTDFIIDIIISRSIEDSNVMGWDLFIRLLLYVILFIGVMIHNEIIIINMCGLGSNTKYYLDLKLKNEELFSEADDETLKKFETLNEEDKNSEIEHS